MSWAHVGTDATAAITAGTGSQNITLPGPPVAGDLVVVAVSGDISCAGSITTADYNFIENGTGANPGAHSGYKVMGTPADTVVAIARHSSVLKSAVVQVYRGGNAADILDVTTAAATGNSNGPQCNTIGTGAANALVVVIAHLDDDDSTVSAWPTNYDTWSVSANTGQSSTAIGSTTAMCARVVAAAGTETPSAFTMSSSDQWQAIVVSFNIASAATAHSYNGLPDGCMALSNGTESFAGNPHPYVGLPTGSMAFAAATVDSATGFNNTRRAILNRIVAIQNEATGFNALKGSIPLSAVERTSDTVVTVTLPALSTFDISSPEEWVVTVPGHATAGGADIVATPTVTIATEGATAYSYTGTGVISYASGSQPSPAIAHGYTGTCAYSHAAAGVVTVNTFNLMRRAIINGIVADTNEAAGWNALKATIPDSALVQIDSTTATLTLPALAYDITAPETWTVTVPGEALSNGVDIVATPTVVIQTEGNYSYAGKAAMSFKGASAYSSVRVLLHVYTGDCTQVYSSGTATAQSAWSEWSEVGTFSTAGIEVGGGMKYSCGTTYSFKPHQYAYVGEGVIAFANGTERSVGRVYVGGGAYHFESGTVIANTVSVAYQYDGSGAIVQVAGTLYETDLAEDFPNSESYIGSGSYSFQSAFERVIGRAWESPIAAYAWSGGAVTAFVTSTWPRSDLEDVPVTRTASLEEAPTPYTGQVGGWTETDQDGTWTEEAVRGSYRDIGYTKEYEPVNRYTATKEDIPL